MLVAVDGIHWRTRARLYPVEGPPRWGGTVMWRGVSQGPRFMTGRTMAMAGCKTRKFVCYPIADDGERSVINWIADLGFPSDYLWNREDWNRVGRLDDFLPHFDDWHFDWLDVPAVIRGADRVLEYPMVDRDPLPRWRQLVRLAHLAQHMRTARVGVGRDDVGAGAYVVLVGSAHDLRMGLAAIRPRGIRSLRRAAHLQLSAPGTVENEYALLFEALHDIHGVIGTDVTGPDRQPRAPIAANGRRRCASAPADTTRRG